MAYCYRGRILIALLAIGGMTVGASPSQPLLVAAAKGGDRVAVQALLAKHVDLNASSLDGTTALHWAVHREDMTLVDELLKAGARVDVPNEYGIMPVMIAAENGNAAILERLLRAGADPNTIARGGETLLMSAARNGNPTGVTVLLTAGANPNARETTREQTALMWAAARGNTAAVKLLIRAGADIQARSSEIKAFHQSTYVYGRAHADSGERLPMFTPLLFAVMDGHIEAARALLDAGANVDDTAPDGTTALHIACINAHWELAGMLVERGADPNRQSAGGAALHHIAHTRSGKVMVRSGGSPPPPSTGSMTAMDLVKVLIAHGADVNARVMKPKPPAYGQGTRMQQVGATPLLMSTSPADPEYAQILLANGADPTLTLFNKTNFLMAAAGLGLGGLLGDDDEAFALVKVAIDLGFDVNAQNDDGDTALHGATFRAYNPLVQYLVDHGARLDVKNNIGWTPLMEARWTGRSLLNTRPETEKLLRTLYEAQGLPLIVPTREQAIQTLVYGRGGPVINCPAGVTVQSADGKPTRIDYEDATARDRLKRTQKLEATCLPASGSVFPVGKTIVTCSTVDYTNRKDSCTVIMRVLP
jgi:ankyrin repeat protein